MKVVVRWIVVLVIWCSWKGGQLGLLPLPPGLWLVHEGMCYLVWRHCVAVLPVVS
jgi:hypothetical protein